MILLGGGTRALVMFNAEMPKEGRGRLYLLNNGLAFDARGKGVRFEASFDSIARFWVERPDKFLLTVRKRWGWKTFVFKMCHGEDHMSYPSIIETDLGHALAEYKYSLSIEEKTRRAGFWHRNKIDFDLFCRTEAAWLECNWHRVMPFVKPERKYYLNEFVCGVRIGSPCTNPYDLVAGFENLVYDDFSNLPGFLRWRYSDMTTAELDIAVSVFRNYRSLTISAFELEVERQSRSRNHLKQNHSLYEHVAITLCRIEEDRLAREKQNPQPKFTVETLHQLLPMNHNCNFED